ncbi:hypothetical protein [Micromonospora humi]|uniref:SnoaL-like domain-containing protein n=1 Tax=Micromonospora humi TaxID=745366 RepID=A0A1C5I5D4_9ACTN|nr:hypothetical protein [Micromonospora humi]SCG53181.1 hypothetical protein GA0070213_104439 [Micromonospora humi]
MNSEAPTSTSPQLSPPVRDWLHQFDAASRSAHAETVADLFSDVFLTADPRTVVPVPRAAFAGALPGRRDLFRSAGLGEPRLVAASETRLDAVHTVLRTEWTVPPLPGADRAAAELASTFLLRHPPGEGIVAVAYLNERALTDILAPGHPAHVVSPLAEGS